MSDFALPPVLAQRTTFFKRPSTGLIGLSLISLTLIVALVVVYTILSGQVSDSKTALHSLQRQTEANTAAIKATTQTDLSNVTANLAAQNKRIGLLAGCLPEIQSELNGLNVSTSSYTIGGTTYLTNAYLANNTLLSSVCKPVLNGK